MAAKEAEKKAQRKRDTRTLTALIVVLVVVVGGGVFGWLRLASPFHRASPRATLSARTAATASVRATPKVTLDSPFSQVTTANGPSADPFSGSPADGWADGAAGITIPAARAHGPYSAAQVRSAFETTRRLLIAGNLDWATLRGGTPKAFADLLTQPERTEFLAGLHKTGLDKNGAAENTRTWVTSFAPGSTKFVTTIIKVRGTMSASTATVPGGEVLRITLNYLFVFAVEPPGNPAAWMRVVQQQYGTVDFGRWDETGSSFEPWFNAGGSASGVLCGERDGYIHPDYPLGPPPSVQPSGKPVNPYSFATPSATAGCRPTTGT